MTLWITVLKPFGYYDDHSVGEKFRMPLEHVNELVQKGFIEIIVNNIGNNKPFDEIVLFIQKLNSLSDKTTQ